MGHQRLERAKGNFRSRIIKELLNVSSCSGITQARFKWNIQSDEKYCFVILSNFIRNVIKIFEMTQMQKEEL